MGETAQTNLQLYNQLIAHGWKAGDLRRARDGYDLTARLFSARYRSSGKPFVAHLVGTASIVVDVDGRPDSVLAGLLHAAYEVGDFGIGRAAEPAARRQVVRSAVGDAAEQLVFEYSRSEWNVGVLTAACAGVDALHPPQRDVLVLRLANEVEEHVDLGARYSDRGGSEVYGVPALEAMAELAGRLDHPQLAARFRLALDAERGVTMPEELRSSDRGSSMRLPASYRRRSAAHVAARVLRKLRGRPS